MSGLPFFAAPLPPCIVDGCLSPEWEVSQLSLPLHEKGGTLGPSRRGDRGYSSIPRTPFGGCGGTCLCGSTNRPVPPRSGAGWGSRLPLSVAEWPRGPQGQCGACQGASWERLPVEAGLLPGLCAWSSGGASKAAVSERVGEAHP